MTVFYHLAAKIVVFCHFPECILVLIRNKDEVGAMKLVFSLTFKAVLLLCIFCGIFVSVCSVFVC